MTTGNSIRAGAPLHLSQGDLQAGERVISVSVPLSVDLVLHSRRVTEVMAGGLAGQAGAGGAGGRSLRSWHLSLGESRGVHGF